MVGIGNSIRFVYHARRCTSALLYLCFTFISMHPTHTNNFTVSISNRLNRGKTDSMPRLIDYIGNAGRIKSAGIADCDN